MLKIFLLIDELANFLRDDLTKSTEEIVKIFSSSTLRKCSFDYVDLSNSLNNFFNARKLTITGLEYRVDGRFLTGTISSHYISETCT